MKIRITKEFDFEAAHALDGYDGKCKNIHGHSYHLTVTFIGSPNENRTISECGMVIDFGEIKSFVNKNVFPLFDHCFIIRKDSRFKNLEGSNERIRLVDYQPTCENMLIEIVELIRAEYKGDILLHSALLRETANSYAEWFLEDNN
ncbi:6-carboxytetrahydropterin synthase [Flavobacteriales bacterium]|nr:6-carboxytetrahydropterin synthase [Flavobacteriales bacterium]